MYDFKIPNITLLIDECPKPKSLEEAWRNWNGLLIAMKMGPKIIERVFNKIK